MQQSQYQQVQEVSVKLKQAASTQFMQNTQDEQSKSYEVGQHPVSPQHTTTTIPMQPIRIQESFIIHQTGFINHSEQTYPSVASAHQDTSNTPHNQHSSRCAHPIYAFVVPEDAHAVAKNNPHELHCCYSPEVLGQTQTGNVRQLAQSHRKSANQKPFCELSHVYSWPTKLIGETQRAREEDHDAEDVVDLNGVDVDEFLCHHHSVAMEGHRDQHGSRHEGDDERAGCEIVFEVRVYLKLRVKEEHDWCPVDHEEHSCEASRHSHNLVAINGDAVDGVVKDEDKKRRDAVEGAGDCEGQVELRKREHESLHHHDTVPEDEIAEVP